MRTQPQINEIVRLLLAEYPEADCTLDYAKPHELLFSVRLAAQCQSPGYCGVLQSSAGKA